MGSESNLIVALDCLRDMHSCVFSLKASVSQGLKASVDPSFSWDVCQMLLQSCTRPKEAQTAWARRPTGHSMFRCKKFMCFDSMQSQALRRVKLPTTWASMHFSTYCTSASPKTGVSSAPVCFNTVMKSRWNSCGCVRHHVLLRMRQPLRKKWRFQGTAGRCQ